MNKMGVYVITQISTGIVYVGSSVHIARLAKAHIETSNRSFAQMARRIRERLERVSMETENMGDW